MKLHHADAKAPPSQATGYGRFWLSGCAGAFIISIVAISELVGGPGFDGPFGGFVWLIAQVICFLACLTESIRCLGDSKVSNARCKAMWLLTAYPVVLFFIMMWFSS